MGAGVWWGARRAGWVSVHFGTCVNTSVHPPPQTHHPFHPQGTMTRSNNVMGVRTLDVEGASVTMGGKVLKMSPGKALRIVGMVP